MRFNVGNFHRDTDISVPAKTCIGELIDDISRIAAAPSISKPWEPSTPAGTILDISVPLQDLEINHGDLIILQPRESRPEPVLREAAEALAILAHEDSALGLQKVVHMASLAGLFAIGVLLQFWVNSGPLTLAVLAVLASALTIWKRELFILALVGIVSAGLATTWWIIGSRVPFLELFEELRAPPLFAGLAVSALLLFLAILWRVTWLSHPVVFSATSIGFIGISGGLLGWQWGGVITAAAILIGLGFIFSSLGPRIATGLAGLEVPKLPAAGQSLDNLDLSIPANGLSGAKLAKQIHHGIVIGIAVTTIPSLAILCWLGSVYTFALALTIAVSYALHGLRHSSGVIAGVSLAIATSAIGFAGLSLYASSQWLWIFNLVLAIAALSSPIWVPLLKPPKPTQIVWWERLETLAIAAAIPLIVHLIGVFELIRGLG
ncbi:type VII secretion integral membrane protein EccD [Corynebacterium caspium]|nr:type VII secretion integral membrane protein EccD [Corynebacterium caspium]